MYNYMISVGQESGYNFLALWLRVSHKAALKVWTRATDRHLKVKSEKAELEQVQFCFHNHSHGCWEKSIPGGLLEWWTQFLSGWGPEAACLRFLPTSASVVQPKHSSWSHQSEQARWQERGPARGKPQSQAASSWKWNPIGFVEFSH